jgi:hypothetical protein
VTADERPVNRTGADRDQSLEEAESGGARGLAEREFVMKRLLVAAALAASFLFGAVPAAQADTSVRQISQTAVGPWMVFGWMTGNIRYCSAERDVGAVRVAFVRLPNGFALLLRSPSWHLNPESTVPVRVAQRTGPTTISGTAIGTDIVLVQLDQTVMSYVAEQQQIDVTAADLTVTIPLDGIVAAVTALETCIAGTSAPQPASTPGLPSGPQPPSQPAQPQRGEPPVVLPTQGPSVHKPQSSATMSPVRGPIQVP